MDFSIRIYYEDTDCGGIVYHTNYIKYCERARSEIFFNANAMPNTQSIGLVVRRINADFLDSARLGDLLKIKSEIIKIGSSSLTLKQEIFLDSAIKIAESSTESLRKKLLFSCEVKLACIDIQRKKIVKIPSEMLAILIPYFKGA